VSAAADVLDRLARSAPPRLWERMAEAVAAAGGDLTAAAGADARPDAVAGELTAGALECLRAVLGSAGDRSAALDLLAADALLTHAFEVAAEAGPERLEEMAWEALDRLVALAPSGEP
jgi:hypothetical protein